MEVKLFYAWPFSPYLDSEEMQLPDPAMPKADSRDLADYLIGSVLGECDVMSCSDSWFRW